MAEAAVAERGLAWALRASAAEIAQVAREGVASA
jgi:hypothetical protein